MRIILLRCIGALTALMMASGAWGAPVEWTLNNALFDDGATAVGSFFYDANFNEYSNINITVFGFAAISGGELGGVGSRSLSLLCRRTELTNNVVRVQLL